VNPREENSLCERWEGPPAQAWRVPPPDCGGTKPLDDATPCRRIFHGSACNSALYGMGAHPKKPFKSKTIEMSKRANANGMNTKTYSPSLYSSHFVHVRNYTPGSITYHINIEHPHNQWCATQLFLLQLGARYCPHGRYLIVFYWDQSLPFEYYLKIRTGSTRSWDGSMAKDP